MPSVQPKNLEGGPEILPCNAEALGADHVIQLLPLRVEAERSIFSTNTATVAKLLNEAGLHAVRLDSSGDTQYRDERALIWLGPILFFSAGMVLSNPNVMNIALGVIANYLTDLFRGRNDSVAVKLQIIEEMKPKEKYRKIEYQGPVEGLRDLDLSAIGTPSVKREGE